MQIIYSYLSQYSQLLQSFFVGVAFISSSIVFEYPPETKDTVRNPKTAQTFHDLRENIENIVHTIYSYLCLTVKWFEITLKLSVSDNEFIQVQSSSG